MVESSRRFVAPPGTQDILPPDSARWEEMIARFARYVGAAGYGLVQSPMFEDVALFARVGEGTDVVRKEMYTFTDRGERELALRPEGTAPVVRAYNQHHPTPPWKVWYAAPSFRYERQQKGRFRQHHQLGVEVLGSEDPDVDVEVIVLLADFYRDLGLERVSLLVNSMGSAADRTAFAALLSGWLTERIGDLDEADRQNVTTNPLRVLDSKRPATQAVTADAPLIVDHLSLEAGAHFERVLAGLAAAGLDARVTPSLVRGLDYYTHTTFEFTAEALDAAQNAIGGGGRYDGLAEALGGRPAPGIGFGTGIERTLLACDAEGVFAVAAKPPIVYFVDVVDGSHARDLTLELRRAGVAAERAFGARSMKSQMKSADRSGATWAVIIGEEEVVTDEVTLRPLRGDGEQRRIKRSELVDVLRRERGVS